MEASITLKKIAKKFANNTILADLSLGVEKGSTLVLVGENGSGKSTLLKILCGMLEKDLGTAYINGMDISTRGSDTRSITGYMPQMIDLDPEMTVLENITLFGELHGLNSIRAKECAINWANKFEIKKHLHKFHSDLCYGHQRLILFIRAVIHDPEILLLDEPTTGMDPHNRTKIWNTLDRMHRKKTILFVTQNFTEAERWAERIAILYNGNIQMDGSLDRLIETTHGLTRYSLLFKDEPKQEFIDEISKYPKVVRAKIKGKELEFYSRERSQFFKILKIALNYQLSDLDTSICTLQDLFIGLTDGGLD